MNKVVHFEVPYDNPDAVKNFYSGVFGWKIQDIPEMNYIMLTTVDVDEQNMPVEKGAINGGMYKRGAQGSRSPVIVIDVESVDEHLKRIEGAGGKVVMPKVQVGQMGFYAQFSDPEGNILGIWETLKSGGQEAQASAQVPETTAQVQSPPAQQPTGQPTQPQPAQPEPAQPSQQPQVPAST